MEAEPEPGLSERYQKTSAWPLVIVLGIVLSEIGLLFNLYPVAITGLIMFVVGVASIIHEAGYARSPWRLLTWLGVSLVAIGLLVVSTQVDGGVGAYIAQTTVRDGITQRGFTIAATGAVLAVAGVVLPRTQNQ